MKAVWIGPHVNTIGPGETGEVFENPVKGDWRPLVFRVTRATGPHDVPCLPEEVRALDPKASPQCALDETNPASTEV